MTWAWFEESGLILQDGGIILCDECPCDITGTGTGTGTIYPDCTSCENSIVPLEMELDMPDVILDGSDCNDCDAYQGHTLVLPFNPSLFSPCRWTDSWEDLLGINPCNMSGPNLVIAPNSENPDDLNIGFACGFGSWYKLLENTSTIDCMNLDVELSNPTSTAYCDVSGTVVRVRTR